MGRIGIFFFILIMITISGVAQTHVRDISKESWSFKKASERQWYPAQVPGTIHTDLLNNNLIPDPFLKTHEQEAQWIELEDWIYKTTFTLSKKELNHHNIELQLDGLDTYAEVYLNGNHILSANNMFRQWTIDVKKLLRVGENSLEIRFESAVKRGKQEAEKLPYTLPEGERVFVRKAQYQFGWDWGPRLVTAGIWKKVGLHFSNQASFNDIHHEVHKLVEEEAQLDFIVQVEVHISGNYDIMLNQVSHTFKLKKGSQTIKIPWKIIQPQLWWTNGSGEPHQYTFNFHLKKDHVLLEQKEIKIGLRTIELVQDKDEHGTSFYFKLNGVPVFMNGANIIPPDSFLPRVTSADYHHLVQQAKAAHMNMLRVWGGGVYADDAFYEACNDNGILVWQDFMFACSMYPGDEAFLQNVAQEVTDQVIRLRNHPSIALWCGNNENDEGWHNWGWQKQHNYSASDSTQIWEDYKKVFHKLIPEKLSELLPKNERRYWSSSPSTGWGRKESLLRGDVHYWGVWWGKEPFEMYENKVGRFVSEYGFQGMPSLTTIRAMQAEEPFSLTNPTVRSHQKHPIGFETIQEYMERDFVVPEDFEDYIYVSQLLQARGMKIAMEAHRRAMPYCMGTLFWQLNDCWPVTSWSSIDYSGKWKAFHYQAKESFAPQLISFSEQNEQLDIVLINDTLEPLNGQLQLTLLDFSGKIIWKNETPHRINGNSSTIIQSLLLKELPAFLKDETVLVATFENEQTSLQSLHYFVNPKSLKLKNPEITLRKIDPFTIEIQTNTLVKNLFLHNDSLNWEINFIDILPGEIKRIKSNQPIPKDIHYKCLNLINRDNN
jgi:beta-mannosidase